MQKIITSLLFSLLFSTLLLAQSVPSSSASAATDTVKRVSFMPVPYINYSRSIGFAAGAIPMAMYKLNPQDTISPASITGLFGMYTTNDSWFTMFFQRFYFNEDNWRITSAGGLGSVNFQFYVEAPLSSFIDYNTGTNFFYIDFQRRVYKKLYVGLHYLYMEYNTKLENLPIEQQVYLNGVGVKLSSDYRDNVYYPRNGTLANVDWTSFPGFLGNDFVSEKIEIDFNHYLSVKSGRDVLASRLYGGFGIGSLAFTQQFIVGQEDIRGYTQGKYRGDQILSLQTEYRLNFNEKVSAVGFAGVASVFNAINQEDSGVVLPGVGAGFRYNIFPEYHMNIGLDAAVGKDDWGIYFRVGEAF